MPAIKPTTTRPVPGKVPGHRMHGIAEPELSITGAIGLEALAQAMPPDAIGIVEAALQSYRRPVNRRGTIQAS